MNKNIYTYGYKKELKNKNIDFTEPAENFIRMYKMFIKKKNLKCLDYGVGDGRHFEFLVRRRHNVVGTDVSDYAIDLTKRRKFDFITSEAYFLSTSTVSAPLIYMHAYCSSLSMAITLADEGSTILTSDGEEIIENCNGEWGGNDLPVCGSCENLAGDVNNDAFIDILDIVLVINYIVEMKILKN